MKRTSIVILAAVLSAGAWAVDLTDAQRAAVEERIKPVGESCLPGDSDCGGVAAASGGGGEAGGTRSGEEVYNAACMACHSTGAAGAPKQGDSAAWADRIAQGMEALYDSGLHGVAGTGMVAKGGCSTCSDDEVKAAVDYMVESVGGDVGGDTASDGGDDSSDGSSGDSSGDAGAGSEGGSAGEGDSGGNVAEDGGDGEAVGRSGEEVYNAACMACHATGVAGAPKQGDSAAWADRIAKGREAMYDSGINGVPGTGMIARGGCGTCSDEEVKAAVDYMLENSQ